LLILAPTLDFNTRALNHSTTPPGQKFFYESNKCRDSQDISNFTYLDQTYRECMEGKSYDPYQELNNSNLWKAYLQSLIATIA